MGIDVLTLITAVALPVVPCASTFQQPTDVNISEVGNGPGRPAEVRLKDAEPVARPSVRFTVTSGG